MMTEPPIDKILEKTDCVFTLVTETAKRARQLIQGQQSTIECDSNKPITIAANEIDQGTVTYRRVRDGYK